MARDSDINALLVRSLTHPANLLPAAAAVAVGFAFGLWPLYLVAAVLYPVLAYQTFHNPSEARKVLERRRGARITAPAPALELTDSQISRLYEEARVEQERLAIAIAESPVPLPEIHEELIGMASDLATLAQQAERVSLYLGSVDLERLRERHRETVRRRASADSPELLSSLQRTESALADQISLAEGLGELRDRFQAETLALVSALGSIRAETVRIAVSSEDGAVERVRERVGSAREQVRGLSASLSQHDAAARNALGAA